MPYQFNPLTGQLDAVGQPIDWGASYQGPWDGGTAYTLGQLVSASGKIYVCIASTTGDQPPNAGYWEEILLQGPQGPQGDTGPQGEPGAGLADLVDDTTPQLGGDLDVNGHNILMADGSISMPLFKDSAETINPVGSISTSADFDLTAGNVVTATVTGAVTITFSNPSPTGTECGFLLKLTNGGAGNIGWPASVDWPGGTPPTLTLSGLDLLAFTTSNAGTDWQGFVVGLDVKTPA